MAEEEASDCLLVYAKLDKEPPSDHSIKLYRAIGTVLSYATTMSPRKSLTTGTAGTRTERICFQSNDRGHEDTKVSVCL